MQDWYKSYIRFGHRFKDQNGNEYKSIMYPEKEDAKLRVIPVENHRRWELLRAWRQNGVHADTPEWEKDDAERAGYEIELPFEELEPIDEIRFIDPNYQDKFTVRTGGKVLLNGEENVVVYIDQTHMFIGKKNGHMNGYHICEFAELCERTNAVVAPLEGEEN